MQSDLFPEDAAKRLKQYVDQALIQRDRVKGEQDQYNAILAAAQADGFDKKVMGDLIKRLIADEKTVQEHDDLLALYEARYRAASIPAREAAE